ncbi:unnamed protein product [Paramecium sonneborni]|uniref:Uncharacterized protein n=1 Tax=Paramecium sonneborni TaxID=65129 RepID=A0A8S1N3J2_9CILI|nr:unnamed protein product [Paramecium sonneborni]
MTDLPPIQNLRKQSLLGPENIMSQNHNLNSLPQNVENTKCQKRNFNLKIGDIIYFKSYLSDDFKGVISGDGIASNKLECIQILGKNKIQDVQSKKSLQHRVGSLSFQKSLFQIITGKKYQYQNQYNEVIDKPIDQRNNIKEDEIYQMEADKLYQDQLKILQEFKKKSDDEQKENERLFNHLSGSNIVYGQEIQLLHIYSGCTLSLNSNILAKQNCCRELSLEENSNENSNFRILSMNSVKNPGEPILYGDQIILQNSNLIQWNLGIQKPSLKFEKQDGLEVNASEQAYPLKISSYIDHKTEEDINKQQIKGKYLQSGDVVTIKNRYLGGYLCIKRIQRITEGLDKKSLIVKDYETNINYAMNQYYFDVDRIRNEKIDQMYQLYVDTKNGADQNLSSLWQIQHIDSLIYQRPTYESVFLIRHVCTGLFLYITNRGVGLTYDGLKSECQFNLKSKKTSNDYISYSEACKIQLAPNNSIDNSISQDGIVIVCINENKVALQRKSQKKNIERATFLLKQAPQDLSKISYRINSLQEYLIQFYIFLQDWGIVKCIELNQEEKRKYEYYEAFNNQKLLFDEIQQLFQTLDNLKMYLTNEGKPQSNEQQQKKQQALMDNDIINLLFAIQRLCNCMIYGNLQENNYNIPDKSPQKIAKMKLDPMVTQSQKQNCIQEIYYVLSLCVQCNPETSNYVLNLEMNKESILEFLLKQLKNQREHVSNLIKESVRYTDMSDAKSSIKKWVNELQPITEVNIEDQALYIEILSLMMIDPYENPNSLCQDTCRRLLFGTKNKPDSSLPFQKALIALDIYEENSKQYPVVQFSPKREKGTLLQLSHLFGQNNPTFCQLYLRFVEKQNKISQRFNTRRPPLVDITLDFFTTETLKENQLVRQEDLKVVLPIFLKYENYLINVMDLYSSLCKGRNQKSIKCLMKNCFLNEKFLEICLQRQQNIKTELRFERTLIELFCNLYLDIDPLIKISQFDNKCFLNDDLDQFDIQNQSGIYFYENNASKQLKRNEDYQKFINQKDSKTEHQYLKLYASKILQRKSINDIRIHYLEMFISINYPDHFKVDEFNNNILQPQKSVIQQTNINYKRLAHYQLQYFLGVLQIIKNSIDLGYNELVDNQQVFSVLPNIFVALILQQRTEDQYQQFQENENFNSNLQKLTQSIENNDWVKTYLPTAEELQAKRKSKNKTIDPNNKHDQLDKPDKQDIQFKRNWILFFLMWTFQYCDDNLLKMKIYLEALQILKILGSLKLNLQILQFLFSKQQYNESNSSSPSSRDQDFDDFNEIQKNDQEDLIKQQKSLAQRTIYNVFKEPDGNRFSALLFSCLLSSEKKNKLNEEILQILIDNLHQPKNSTKEIKEVEIIDDLMELKYFSIINGNSSAVQIISPKEAQVLTKRAVKFIKNTRRKKNTQKRITSFDQLKNYQSKIIEQFESFFKPNSQEIIYLRSFQNIVRNAGVHLVFLEFLIEPKNICSSPDIVQFYKRLILFFEYFIKDNETNIGILASNKYLYKLLDIIQIEQQEAEDWYYIPLKITKIFILLISKISTSEHANLIINIFERIKELGEDLMKSQEFFVNAYSMKDDYVETKITARQKNLDGVAYYSLIQYLRILKSLTKTFETPAEQSPLNKHLILNSILKNDFLRIVLEPINYYQRILIPEQGQEQQILNVNEHDSLHYHRIKLHAQLIMLITECCQYYRLGIQEMQRIILYEQLKQILLHPNSEYIVKRAYLQCLFELYINKVKEGNLSNDTVESDEVRDILSRIIIPELDQKQICKLLEGLAKLINQDKNKKVPQKNLREQITRQKQNYFEKRLSIDQNSDKELGILRDSSEFWTYLRKNGIIHFLVYTYDEMKDRIDIENPENSNLSDEFAIIKQNVQKIKEIFNVLERDFRVKKEDLDLDDYRELIISIEEIIPQRKITKFGQNFRIGFIQDKNADKLLFDKYDTLKEDQTGEKKLQEQDNVQRIENPFRRNFKIYLIRYKLNIYQFCLFIEKEKSDEQEKSKKILKTCNIYKQYIQQNDIDYIYKNDVARIKNQESINNRKQSFTDWDLFKQAMRELFERKFNANNTIQEIQTYQRQQESLEKLKIDFQLATIRLIANYYKKLKGQLKQNINLISEDVQIELLIKTLERQQTNVFNIDNLQIFLRKCQEIFLDKEIYLIKLCRIFLSLKRPTQDEIDSLTEAKDEDSKKTVREKKEAYIRFQKAMADGQLDILAFDMLNQNDVQQKIEALSFLIHLLDYGNEYVQKKFYKLLKEEQVKQKFLIFLRGFFLINLDVRITELEQSKNHNTEYKLLCLKVLQLLQALCENVNMEFQKFLVFQYDDDSYQANINIVNEVASLLADLLEKGQKAFNKLQEVYRQALESLVEFSTGYVENKKELCKNSRLFTLLNSILQISDLQNFHQIQPEQDVVQEKQQFNLSMDEDLVLDVDEIGQDKGKRKYTTYQTLQSFIKLLLLLTQGRADVESLEFILNTVNITNLIRIAKSIYEERIQPKQRNIVLDNICDESETGIHQNCTNSLCHFGLRTDEDNMLIQTGFNIFIICLKLSEHFPLDPQLKLFEFDQEQEEHEELLDSDDFQEEDIQRKKTLSNQKILPINPESKYDLNQDENDNKLIREEYYQTLDLNIKNILEEVRNNPKFIFERSQRFFKFYRQFTGRIEIQNEINQLEKVYFQKPFICNFITPNIKQHLIYEINRETDEDRMLGLIEFSEFYQIQMRHSQQINNRKIMRFGAVYWRLLKDLSFLLCLIIVVLLIFMHDTVINSKIASNTEAPEDKNITVGESVVSYLNNIITIIQLILNLIIVFFCAIERYPISITYNRGQTNAKRVQILKKEAGFQISWLTMKYYSMIGFFESEFQEDKVNQSIIKKLILVIFFDFDNFYNICIFGLTVYAFFNPYIYAVILLDIIKRSEDLQNIIKSITSNGRNLAIFSFLGLIGLLIYAIIAFSNFNQMFDADEGVFGQTFILAVTSTINFGLRNGGGLGESLTSYPDAYDDPTLYWGRYFFDFTFFIIFNILFIQIIFGIILDTFGELRDERQALVKEIEGKCFICSQEKNDIDTKGTKGWHYHIYLEHSVYHMLYYIIYIKNKDPNDCNSLEKYVNKCIIEKETKFFPFGRALQTEELDNDEEIIEKQ